MLSPTLKKLLKTLLINSSISGAITAAFMYLIFFEGPESVAAGFCIGFSVYLGITAYKRQIERRYFQKLNLIQLLLATTLAQVIIILLIAMFFVGIFYMQGHFELYFTDDSVLMSRAFLVGLTFGLILSMIFSFLNIVSTIIGKNILGNLFIGKYSKPREEDRIFMFLDLTSSTSIAEKIGHLQYLSLLNDFFHDIVGPIDQTKGEIYKYVGDEVIITWKKMDGIRNQNCLACFFLIEKRIRERSGFYMRKYGLVPEFKAGLHCGIAVMGEIGYWRREIAFVGDVLNTTSRIMDECKNFNRSILVSEDLVKQLPHLPDYKLEEVGTASLRGKEKEMKLYTF
jgi:class 3 adenylate cyclase